MLGEVLEAATTNIMSVFPNMSAAPFDRGPCANDCSFGTNWSKTSYPHINAVMRYVLCHHYCLAAKMVLEC